MRFAPPTASGPKLVRYLLYGRKYSVRWCGEVRLKLLPSAMANIGVNASSNFCRTCQTMLQILGPSMSANKALKTVIRFQTIPMLSTGKMTPKVTARFRILPSESEDKKKFELEDASSNIPIRLSEQDSLPESEVLKFRLGVFVDVGKLKKSLNSPSDL